MRIIYFSFLSISISLGSVLPLFGQFPEEGYNLNNPTFLDSTVADYDIFLNSEAHLRKANSPRKKKMIKYLASKNSVDVIILERAYHFGYWVNCFLETGDSLLLKEYLNVDDFFSTINGKVVDNEYEFYRWLRQFNITNKLTIRVEAIDVATLWDEKPILWTFLKLTERNPGLKKQLPESVEMAQRFMQKKNLGKFRMIKWVKDLMESCDKLQIDNQDFLDFVFNLKQSIPWAWKTDYNVRDQLVARNFKKFVNEGEKVYGQFGFGHILIHESDRNFFRSFASILNQDKYYKGKILSAGLVCIRSDPYSKENPGEFRGAHIFKPFLTQEEFDRLKPGFLMLPSNTFVDLRATNERAKDYTQLLLIEFD